MKANHNFLVLLLPVAELPNFDFFIIATTCKSSGRQSEFPILNTKQGKLNIILKNLIKMSKDNFWKNKNVFITGVAGFVGSNLAKDLVKK